MDGLIFLIVVVLIVVGIIISSVRIVPQSYAYVIERLGAFKEVWGVGVHVKIPLIESVSLKVSLKEKVVDFEPQPVITKDNVTITIDTILYFQVTDPKLYCYGVENPIYAIEKLTVTSLRNIIGDMELDQTLTSRDVINTKLRSHLDGASDSWGLRVLRAELKNIIPPAEIQQSMEKQMKAERDKRQAILIAEGEKQSAILVAEGNKASMILNAEAERESTILRAEAQKQLKIKEAEGQAEAILRVQEATAKGIGLINNAVPSKEYLALKSLETLEKVGDGQATKIIIPSEIQDLSGLLVSLKETVSEKPNPVQIN